VCKILLVAPSLAYGGMRKQLLLLASELRRPPFEVRVAVLGRNVRQLEDFRDRGILVHELGWNRLLDIGPVRRLRQLVNAFRPNVIHAWQLPSLRFLASAGAIGSSGLIASDATPRRGRRFLWHTLDPWLLRAADLIVATGSAEAHCYQRQKVPPGKIVQVPPGVSTPSKSASGEPCYRSLGIDRNARLIVCAGPFLPEKGFLDAIWAFEILHFLYDDLHLLLVGSGPDEERLKQFAGTIGAKNHVHFLGEQPDVTAWIGHSEVVWIPSLRRGGVNVALEAMAAGRPIVASRLPALAEIVKDGVTGLLVAPGDKVALARTTRLLLDDPQRCAQMGEAGRCRVDSDFTTTQLVGRFARFYEDVGGRVSREISA
jgi:glycosyltransferase involved in cell wall biosynthesis